MTVELKKYLGEGGAGLDSSFANDNLHAVLKAIAEQGQSLDSFVAGAVSLEIIAGKLIRKDSILDHFAISLDTPGSAGTTSVQVIVNGNSVKQLDFANTVSAGTVVESNLDIALKSGDRVQFEVVSSATGAEDLFASAHIAPVDVK